MSPREPSDDAPRVALPAWLEPLLDAEAMRAADAWAIEGEGIPSLDLMETAGAAVAEAVAELAPEGPVRIVCGKGNNGGDGLVAARQLAGLGLAVDVLLLWPADELSDDARSNLGRLPEGAASEVGVEDVADALAGSGAIVDAIFGTGFDSAPREPAASAIEAINGCDAPVVACDIASGISASDGTAAGAAVEAEVTVTFHAAKVGHRIAPGARCTGELRVADIGIPAGAPAKATAGVIAPAVLDALPRRGAASTKFSSGNVLLVGASRGLTGAVAMASSAAIRAGAGYAAAAVPASLEPILEAKLTEVMTIGVAEQDGGLTPAAAEAIAARAESAACVVLGPGAGRTEPTQELLRDLATRLDASAADRRRRAQRDLRAAWHRASRGPAACHDPARGRARPTARHGLGGGRSGAPGVRPQCCPRGRRHPRAQGRGHDRHRRRARRRQRVALAGPCHGGHRRRALGHDRRPDRARG